MESEFNLISIVRKGNTKKNVKYFSLFIFGFRLI